MADGSDLPDALLIVDVAGFEGPLGLLLALSRSQKVDLRRIRVLDLAEQYLAFVERAAALRLDLAADYLVMAAWLAYLKSRLLLPAEPDDAGPTGAEMAAHLAFRLARLAAMRTAAEALFARDLLGRDTHPRGAPEAATTDRRVRVAASLGDLLRAYARLRTRDEFRPLAFERRDVCTLEHALAHTRAWLAATPGWADALARLPVGWDTVPARRRSATAAAFAAALELARRGEAELRQAGAFAALEIRKRPA